jgi:fumarate reductase flavoprotein subunit
MREQKAFDVVVVGGGLAGCVAAGRATELGLSVCLLEAGTEDRYACNARFSGGVFHIAFTDIKSPVTALRAAIDTATDGRADAAQADTMAANAGRLVDWLKTQGAQFIRTRVSWQNFILAPPRPMVAGQEWMGRGPDVLLRRLGERIVERGGRFERGARGRSLLIEDGRCVGIEAETAGSLERIDARAVIIADGGYQANPQMLREIVPDPDRVKQRGGATGVGDGLTMAVAVGAETTGRWFFYGHLLCRDAMTNDKVWPYPELDAIAAAGIVVDARGRRVIDEGVGGVALANAIAQLPDPLATSIVFDAAIWNGPAKSARIPANPTLANAGGTIHSADTLDALAAKAGLDPAVLHRSVAAYNDAVGGGRLAELAPLRSTHRFSPMPIATPPFMAIPIVAGITYTMGGIRVDGACRVMRAGGGVIEGLYAAGSTTGGLEGGDRAAYVGGLAKAGVHGLVAAEHIAATK